MTLWHLLTPEQKREAVRPLVAKGQSYAQVAEALGAPSRSAIAGVVDNSRRFGNRPIETPNLEGRPKPDGTPRRHADKLKAPQIAQEKARRARAKALTTETPEPASDRPAYDYAWDALPGSQPVRLEDHTTGCRWPVTVEGESVARFCNLDVGGTNRYCFGHMLLGTRPEVPRAPRTTAGKTVKFNL